MVNSLIAFVDMKKLGTVSIVFILAMLPVFYGFISVEDGLETKQTENINEQIEPQHYIDAVDGYMRGLNEKDLEGILSLYADNATVEDPVGSEIVSGKVALREFYSGAVNIDLTVTRTGPVRIAGVEVAFPFQLRMDVGGESMKTDIIDVFRFDEAGKIVSMRAFWGPTNRKPATE